LSKSPKIWKCIIADDEPLAREVISKYVTRIPSLQLVGECSNAVQVIESIQQQEIDLIFLDIQMPEISGTDLIRILKNAPYIIITTAFQEYSLEGYELDVVDYLLKPIKFERFLKAVTKVFRLSGEGATSPASQEKLEPQEDAYLYFRTDRKTVKVMLNEILYVEGMGNYVKVFTEGGMIITKNSMTTVETMLSETLFIRVHRSFIVSKTKIKSFSGEVIAVGKIEIPIGKLYKNNVIKMLSQS
jgi:two-component system, LytTR family, response regulator